MTTIENEIFLASLQDRILRLVDYHEALTTGNFQLVLDIWQEALDDGALGKMISQYHKKDTPLENVP